MPQRPIIIWFRNDLRLHDHAALAAASTAGASVVPVFILDDAAAGQWLRGGASRWWLHHSLVSLATDIRDLGGTLLLRQGDTTQHLIDLVNEVGAGGVYFSRAYEPWAVRLEQRVKDHLERAGVLVRRFANVLLREPEEVRTKSGEPFRVYTPFWRALCALAPPNLANPPVGLPKFFAGKARCDDLASLDLLPKRPDWAGGLRATWQPGETGARTRLKAFLADKLRTYAQDRNFPDRAGTSRLSPHLHFGEINPRRVWLEAARAASRDPRLDDGLETFLKELAWRDFSYHLLFHWPELPERAFRPEFETFPWAKNEGALDAWQLGATGYPIVDAGMRELWHTGYMHNRVRMIVASFLVKHLLIPWQQGEAWFWDTLVDADLANNAASWQWVAGSGADAAPYFRIFNPVVQGEKFDPDGDYVRRWVPELRNLLGRAIHAPWLLSTDVLSAAGVTLGSTYPLPIVDHAAARARALHAFQSLKARVSS